MILNIKDKNIHKTYKTYFESLNIEYTDDNGKIIIENTIKHNKLII